MSVSREQIASIAAPARARAVAAFDADLDTAGDLRAQCVAVSLYLRDALRAGGHADAIAVAGYFEVEGPDPEVCACGSYVGTHDEACYFEPHAWVQVAGWLVDATASQFNDSNQSDLDDLVILPAAEALNGPWRATVSWSDDWAAGEISSLMGDWPASLGPMPTR